MNDYTVRDRQNYGEMDVAKRAFPKFQEKLEICRNLFFGYDYTPFYEGSDLQRGMTISGAVNFIVAPDKEEQKQAFIKEALMLKQSVKSDGVINLFSDVGEKVNLFDPTFLENISKMKEKNLAVEMLKKLIDEQVKVYKCTNLVKSEAFSELIQQTLNRYLNGMLTNEEVIQELLKLAKENAPRQRGRKQIRSH